MIIKKNHLFFSLLKIISLLFIFLITLSACNCRKNLPWDYTDVEWYSINPEIVITVKDGNSSGYIIKDEGKIYIDLLWGETFSFEILYSGTEIVSSESVLLGGSVNFNDNEVWLKVETDNLFNNKYSVITLYRRSIE